ncbi:hypothetical protein ACSBR2_000633 [Camellia fascicularis]
MALPIVSLFWLPSHSPPFFPFSDLATVAVAQSGGLAPLLSQCDYGHFDDDELGRFCVQSPFPRLCWDVGIYFKVKGEISII